MASENWGSSSPFVVLHGNPSIKSSLVFLRKTEWARTKVEELYLKTDFNSETFKLVEEEYFASKAKKK